MSQSGLVESVLLDAPCGFITFADDGRVVFVNDTLLEILGYDRADVVGQHIEQLMPVPTRIFYQTHWFPMVRLHGAAEEVFLLLRSRTGEDVGMLSYARRRPEGGALLNDCVLVRVKERAKYEEELLRAKRIAEASNEELHAQKAELRQMNQQLEAQAVELEMQQEQLQNQTEQLEQAMHSLQESHAALRARSEQAEVLRAVAERANQAKTLFFASMSHDLRTPLNAISGYLQILETQISGPLNEKQQEIISRIARSSEHLLTLVDQVLNLAKAEAGKMDFTFRKVNLGALVHDILPMVQPQIAEAQLDFSCDLPDAVSAEVDVEKTHQIVINLITNAVKFTPAGGKVTLSATNESDGSVILRVADTGPGIPEEHWESIFEPFVQTSTASTSESKGWGLGLSISREIARGMGGDLWVESTPGHGSTFLLRLPSEPERAEPSGT